MKALRQVEYIHYAWVGMGPVYWSGSLALASVFLCILSLDITEGQFGDKRCMTNSTAHQMPHD